MGGKGNEMKKFGIGQSVSRIEDARLLTGKGRYTDDIVLPGQAYMAFVRSPHAHADVVSVDFADAAAAPGVLGVFTGDDLARDGIGTLPNRFPLKQSNGEPLVTPPRPALPGRACAFTGGRYRQKGLIAGRRP